MRQSVVMTQLPPDVVFRLQVTEASPGVHDVQLLMNDHINTDMAVALLMETINKINTGDGRVIVDE